MFDHLKNRGTQILTLNNVLSHDHQVIQWNNPWHKKSYDHMCYNTCKASHWLDLLHSLIFNITPLVDSNQDGILVRWYKSHFWNRSCL